MSHQGSPRILEWVAYPFSRDLPDPGIEPGSSALQVDSLQLSYQGTPAVWQFISKAFEQGCCKEIVLDVHRALAKGVFPAASFI